MPRTGKTLALAAALAKALEANPELRAAIMTPSGLVAVPSGACAATVAALMTSGKIKPPRPGLFDGAARVEVKARPALVAYDDLEPGDILARAYDPVPEEFRRRGVVTGGLRRSGKRRK